VTVNLLGSVSLKRFMRRTGFQGSAAPQHTSTGYEPVLAWSSPETTVTMKAMQLPVDEVRML